MFYTDTITYRTAEQLNTAMAGVYKHMTIAVLTSMLVSWWVASNAAIMAVLFGTALKWVVIFAPLVAVFAIGFAMHRVSKSVALFLLHGFAALMGLSMASIFAAYTSMSITTAFMGAAVLFGVMSFWGYFTRQDLSGWGKWLLIAVIAIVIASIINIFIGSSLMSMLVSAIAVIVFTALTAYDTQRIREELSTEGNNNAEVGGALSLYLNFINIFISLLQLTGNKE